MRVFISYSSKDRELVRALSDDLEALGYTVWFDKELSRTGGQHWWSNILTNVRECDLFIFALTPNSLASAACQLEYRYADALHKRILPLVLATTDINTLPPELQEIQFVDYRDHTSRQALALAGSLNSLPPAQPLPDPLPVEPEAPLSPLARLTQRIEAQSLSSAEQIEIVFELESMHAEPLTRASADSLLRRMQERDDLVYNVGQHINRLLATSTPAAATQVPKIPARAPAGVPMRGLAVLAIVIIVGIMSIDLFANRAQSGSAATPSTTPSLTVMPATATNIPTATLPATATPTHMPSATQRPSPVPTNDPTCQITILPSDPVTIYNNPNTNDGILVPVFPGDKIDQVIGRTQNSAWFQVRVPGYQSPGWVEAAHVRLSGNCDALPIVQPPPSPTPPPAQQQQQTMPPIESTRKGGGKGP